MLLVHMEQNQNPNTLSASQTVSVAPSTEAHHVSLSDPSWTMWRWSVLRGTGFPSALPLQLSSPTCVAVADQFASAEQSARQAESRLILELTRMMESDPSQALVYANIVQR